MLNSIGSYSKSYMYSTYSSNKTAESTSVQANSLAAANKNATRDSVQISQAALEQFLKSSNASNQSFEPTGVYGSRPELSTEDKISILTEIQSSEDSSAAVSSLLNDVDISSLSDEELSALFDEVMKESAPPPPPPKPELTVEQKKEILTQ
ncbi:hypothetical protein D3C74_296910 [compost metagenome]